MYRTFIGDSTESFFRAQLEGDLGEILALGGEIWPYIGLREKLESPLKKKFFFFLDFGFFICQHTIDRV